MIFRNTQKWRVKHACIASLDFVNLKTFVREYTIKKSVKIFLGAKDQKLVKKDIQRSVKNTKLTKDANLEANVPTNIQMPKVLANVLETKIEALESLVNKMGQKIIKLEGELKDIKHVQTISDSIIEKDSIVNEANLTNQADLAVKDKEENNTEENKKEMLTEANKETTKNNKPHFKCDACGATFKNKSTIKKHYSSKHEEQYCKVCNVRFKTSIEVLQHVAKDHSENIPANISVKEKEKHIEEQEEDIAEDKDSFDRSTKFKCFKCKEIVSLDDKFNDDIQEDQMCKLCTMFQAYGN